MTAPFRRRPRRLALLVALCTTLFVFVVGASAVLTGSTFEGNDANLVVSTAGNKDWDNAPNLSARQDLPKGTDDNSFGNGSKEDETAVTVGGGSIPNSKANLARFAVAGESVGANSFLYLAWSREDQSGTVNFDFEINAAEQPDLVAFGPKTLNRTVGDLLINYLFQGSATPTLNIRTWNGSAWGNPASLTGCSEGQINTSTVSDTLGGLPAVDRPAGQFGEAAINLVCAGVIQPNTCAPFSSAYVKSRSSTSFNSEIKDFIAPVHLSLTNCGSLTVVKRTNPRGLDQTFSYTATGSGVSGFSLNDKDGATGDSANNTKTFSNLQPGVKVITEGADPTGFAFASLTCTDSGGNSTSKSGKVATVTVAGGGSTTCVYVNDQQLGAIKISKASIKTSGSPPVGIPLAGAKFSVTTNATPPVAVTGSPFTTGADGSVCVGGLAFGTYVVTETEAPAGYKIDDTTSHNVVVDTNTTCAASPYVGETFSATDTPLTDILVKAKSQATGGTASRVTCVNSASPPVNIGNSPQPSASTFADPAQVDANGVNGVVPGTYTCTIIVDP